MHAEIKEGGKTELVLNVIKSKVGQYIFENVEKFKNLGSTITYDAHRDKKISEKKPVLL